MATVRDRIDPQSRAALDALLAVIPGGFGAVADITERRATARRLREMAGEVAISPNVVMEERIVRGPDGAADVPVRVFRPADAAGRLPGIYQIHGGGMSMGGSDVEAPISAMLCETIGAVVVSVDYRLAPEHPYPAGLEDCYSGLVWMAGHAEEIGVDCDRVAVFGGSAGGGLSIATALLARDRGGPSLCHLMALYPMIDDRNETASSREIVDIGIWDRPTNVEAWEWYLGGNPPDRYAAPARAEDLAGLPPTFIDVGDCDLFRDEDIAFAARLLEAGVPTELHVYPGAYHGSEIFAPDAALSARIWACRLEALKRALRTP